MKKERAGWLSRALLPLWGFTQSMINFSFHYPRTDTTVYCKNPDCFALALGSLIRSITSGGLRSILMAEQFNIPESPSLQGVITAIENIKMTTLILEGSPTSYNDYMNENNPTHNSNKVPTLKAFQALVADLPDGIFLRNQYESATKHTTGECHSRNKSNPPS